MDPVQAHLEEGVHECAQFSADPNTTFSSSTASTKV